jgi:chitooligosaccharide deacetylase
MSWLIVAGFAIVGLTHVAPFPFLLDKFAPRESLWRVPPAAGGTPTVYLTFDDGPNPEATPQLLDALRETGGRATFFLIYDHLSAETAPIVQRMFAEGHEVGLHSDSRALMVQTPAVQAAILQDHAARIELLAGRPPCRLFRPHAGWRSGAMIEALRSIDHRLVGWSFGLWDFNWYRRPDPATLAARLAKRADAGDIVVMHDGHHENPRADRRHTVEAVRRLVPALRARGFEMGTLC